MSVTIDLGAAAEATKVEKGTRETRPGGLSVALRTAWEEGEGAAIARLSSEESYGLKERRR